MYKYKKRQRKGYNYNLCNDMIIVKDRTDLVKLGRRNSVVSLSVPSLEEQSSSPLLV